MKDERDTLYIPQGIRNRNEIVEGFGKPEIVKTLIFTLIVSVFDYFYFLLGGLIPNCVLIFMVSVAAAILMLAKERTTNTSAVDQVGHMLRYWRSQKYYPYRYKDEWK